MAGSGHGSEPCEGVDPLLFRGMAPGAELIAYADGGYGPDAIAGAIATHGMDLSNHSHVQSLNGYYDPAARSTDELIRGGVLSSGESVSPRAMVFSVGNNGEVAEHGVTRGYFAVDAPAKNSLAIGATTGTSDHLARFSGLGPTWDGRIKPDLVAPGDRITSTERGGCYDSFFSGTSFSAPAVTGILALVLEQLSELGWDLDSDPPLPSTLRALLIQSATDLVHETPDGSDWPNPDTGSEVLYHEGPDYATGYGLVNAIGAVSLVREDNFLQGSIGDRDQVDETLIRVGPGVHELQLTLAWDDEAYRDTAADETEPRLVNDLELRLIDPAGAVHLPWVLAPLEPAELPGSLDPILPGDIGPAFAGEDHRNTVEQVTVRAPRSGTWRVQVSLDADSPGLLDVEQPYSLAGDLHGTIHFTDWAEDPGSVYRIAGGLPEPIYTSPGWRIYHSAFSPAGHLFVNRGNGLTLYMIDPVTDQVIEVYTHQTYVRDLAFDPTGFLYISEASGATSNGMIYLVITGMHTRVEPFYEVRLTEVDGFWAGDFTFDRDGTLYLSSGNRSGGHIYRVDDPSAGGPAERVHSEPADCVCGIAFDRDNRLHYSSWCQGTGTIYRLDLDSHERTPVHSFPDRRIWDVSFR
jgi:hypothetical protein